MPYIGALRTGSRRFLAALAIGLLFVACIPQRAEAQVQYSFTFAGPTSGSATFVGLIIEATRSGFTYTATGANFSGTYGGQTITSISGNWQWSGVDGARADFGNTGANPNPSLTFTTAGGVTSGSVTNATQFNLNRVSIFGSWDVNSPNGFGFTVSRNSNGNSVTVSQVPGPLAGAGILSWLAVMLMGLAWRWQGKRSAAVGPADKRSDVERPRLLAKARIWLAALWRRDAPRAA